MVFVKLYCSFSTSNIQSHLETYLTLFLTVPYMYILCFDNIQLVSLLFFPPPTDTFLLSNQSLSYFRVFVCMIQ